MPSGKRRVHFVSGRHNDLAFAGRHPQLYLMSNLYRVDTEITEVHGVTLISDSRGRGYWMHWLTRNTDLFVIWTQFHVVGAITSQNHPMCEFRNSHIGRIRPVKIAQTTLSDLRMCMYMYLHVSGSKIASVNNEDIAGLPARGVTCTGPSLQSVPAVSGRWLCTGEWPIR